MKIVVDDLIPWVDELFQDHIVIKKPGQSICQSDLVGADILWVRTLTPVTPQLLQGTTVKFVGSATAGFDHFQTKWLEEQGIGWGYAPGSNAGAVAEYVDCCIAALQTQGWLTGKPLTAGIIGVGHAGSAVAKHLSAQGFSLLLNDPPRHERDQDFQSAPLGQFKAVDLVCVHAALTMAGKFPSYHLLNDEFFSQLKPNTVVINAARGGIIDTQVLMRQNHLPLCLDVWENEPNIDLPLLAKAVIATPHIAGYSVEAKLRASLILYEKTKAFFGWKKRPSLPEIKAYHGPLLEHYNPLVHTQEMRQLLHESSETVGKAFLDLRNRYAWR